MIRTNNRQCHCAGYVVWIVALNICVLSSYCVDGSMLPPIIRDGTVRAANGQLLRGGSLHISKQYSARANAWGASRDSLLEWRDKIHYNCIRLCCLDGRAINDGRPTAAFATVEEEMALADPIINNAESLGIYVMINYHVAQGGVATWTWSTCAASTQPCDGTINTWDPRNFWAHYASRYNNRPHVFYELWNECNSEGPPNETGDVGWTWQSKRVYDTIRAYAPNRLVVHGDPAFINASWGPWLKNDYAPTLGFSWTSGKDAFAFHAYDGCTIDAILQTRSAGIPIMCTEFSYPEDGWGCANFEGCKYPAQWCERNGIDWFDWMSWNAADQGRRVNWIVPDAISKGWAWWTPSSVCLPQIRAEVPEADDGEFLLGTPGMVQANGRMVAVQTRQNGKQIRLSIFPLKKMIR